MNHQKQTIVIVAHDIGPNGGMERHLMEKIRRLKHDANVIVVASSLQMSEEDRKDIRFIKIPVIRRPIPLKMVMFALLASLRLMFIKRDLLHTTGAIVWNRADITTVHFCHAGYLKQSHNSRVNENKSLLKRWNSQIALMIALWMEKMMYKPSRTKVLVAVSNRVKAECLEHFPYGESQVHVVPNGVDLERFRPYSMEERELFRELHGLPAQAIIMLFMGGDWSRKGLDYVIDAFNRIGLAHQSLHLVVVGSGDADRNYAKVDRLLQKRVHFIGLQQNPEIWFGISDIFVFPSEYETFSLVVHEAAASGLLILTTKVGGVEDLIVDQSNGVYIQRDAKDIAQKLTMMLKELEKYQQEWGILARKSVSTLTWDNTYKKFIEIYKKLLHIQAARAHIPLGELRRSADD